MYCGGDSDGRLELMKSGQAELRARLRREAEARRAVESGRKWSFASFRLWRLHVFISFERAGR